MSVVLRSICLKKGSRVMLEWWSLNIKYVNKK